MYGEQYEEYKYWCLGVKGKDSPRLKILTLLKMKYSQVFLWVSFGDSLSSLLLYCPYENTGKRFPIHVLVNLRTFRETHI